MRRLSLIIFLVCLMTSGAFGATVNTWYGSNAGDESHPIAGTGNWNDRYWDSLTVPANVKAPPQAAADEIKLTKQTPGLTQTVCTVDTNVGEYLCKISIASTAKLEITAGSGNLGYIGLGEVRVGSGGSTATLEGSTIGYVTQSGGTLNLNDNLLVGRYGASTSNDNSGDGFYTISGGTIQYSIGNTKGNLQIGGTGGDGNSTGVFTVVGDDASISIRGLYVGSDGTRKFGTGTLEFQLTGSSPGTVSAIDAQTTVLDAKDANSTANLVVSLISGTKPYGTPIVLVRNSSATAVAGIFDSVTLNGLPGYYLVYNHNADGTANDIALIPEPATIALFGLGLLALVRRPRRK